MLPLLFLAFVLVFGSLGFRLLGWGKHRRPGFWDEPTQGQWLPFEQRHKDELESAGKATAQSWA